MSCEYKISFRYKVTNLRTIAASLVSSDRYLALQWRVLQVMTKQALYLKITQTTTISFFDLRANLSQHEPLS